MYQRIIIMKQRARDWSIGQVRKPYAEFVLGIVSFTESAFLPIPPDFLLAPLVAVRRDRWVRYALVTTITSILGAILGYIIGAFLFNAFGEKVISFYGLESQFAHMQILFEQNAFLAMFVSAFTIIPFKVFTIAGGIFRINFFIFIIASIIGRGLRFFAVAWLMHRFGERIGKTVYQYFSFFALLFILIIILVLFLV